MQIPSSHYRPNAQFRILHDSPSLANSITIISFAQVSSTHIRSSRQSLESLQSPPSDCLGGKGSGLGGGSNSTQVLHDPGMQNSAVVSHERPRAHLGNGFPYLSSCPSQF